jgi:hypothetical protein
VVAGLAEKAQLELLLAVVVVAAEAGGRLLPSPGRLLGRLKQSPSETARQAQLRKPPIQQTGYRQALVGPARLAFS